MYAYTLKKVCLLFLFILAAGYAFSNSYRLTTLSSNDGLSQQDVECIIQDKHGFIWIGTYDGLNRYDGNDFLRFRHIPDNPNSISDNRILSLQEWPERDELWIGTDGGGLNCYNLKTHRFTQYLATGGKCRGLTDNQVTCFEKQDNELWIGTANGPHRITFSSGNKIHIEHFTLKSPQDEAVLQYTVALAHDNNGNLIAGTTKGLFVKSPGEDEFRPVENMEITVRQLMKDQVGNLWLVTDQAIYYYSVYHQKIRNYLSAPYRLAFHPDAPFRKLLPVTDRLFLAATLNKLYWLQLTDNTFDFKEVSFTQNTFFADNGLKALLLDRTMNVWITSSMDGVARFDLNAKTIYHYPLAHPKANDKLFIQALIKDHKGRLWIGASNGVFIEDFAQRKTLRIESINENIYGIIEDNDKNIWISSLNNLYFIPEADERKVISVQEQPGLPKEACPFDGPYALCTDNRNTVWVGMRNGLLQIRKKETGFSYKVKDIQPAESMRAVNNVTKLLFFENENSLLIGTKNAGLLKARLTPEGEIDTILPVSRLQRGKEEHIWSVLQASDGTIYVGTDSGLEKLIRDSAGQTELTPVSDDLRVQTYKIAAIAEDNHRNLWLSTSLGLLRYSPLTGEVIHYLDTDGLSTNILGEGSYYDPKGILFVGSIKGINKLDLGSLETNDVAPETQITALKINNTPIIPQTKFNGRVLLDQSPEFTKNITLKHNENNFTVEFAALHFSNPAKNKFAYLLKGFNEKWTEVNNNIRSATFTNVPPGTYTLLVKSSNCDGIWDKTGRTLTITVTPAPWNTYWAYLLYALILTAILYCIYKYYKDKASIKKQLFMEHLEHKKEMEIAEVKLKYHTNITHELRTPLSLISAPVEELIEKSYQDEFLTSRLHIIKNNADRLLQLISQFLDFRKVINEKYTLCIRKTDLQKALSDIYADFQSMAQQKQLTLEYYNDTDTDEYWCDKDIIYKICFNLLSNAVKYTPAGGKITLYASQSPDHSKVYISVEDTGIGIDEKEIDKIFDRFYQIPGSTGGTGVGLNLCKHLAGLHQGKISVKSRPGEGSIFTLEIPNGRNAYPEDSICENPSRPEDETVVAEPLPSGERAKPLILVVEDNFELRDYMVSLLSKDSKVIVANNGQEGYDKAVGHVPDLIVSDIMMPIMDGIELTQKAKNDIRTSHIPVILLTAKTTRESEIEGLFYGADDYITKPFNPQVLKLRISNQLRRVQKKKEEIDEGIRRLNERELAFLTSFENIVTENLSSPDFGIEEICRSLAMSRMQLYRKMTAIISKKPSQYIKEIKMKKAYALIKEKGLNITETMYEVGYTNYSHFSRLFAEVNGCSPREMLGMKTRNNASAGHDEEE